MADTPRSTPTLAGKLGWLALGTVLTFALFEGGFRALELVLHRGGDAAPGGEVTILAEGDSFTYGIGGLSFPQQLEEVLEERTGSKRFRAINEGVPGLNSAMLADRFEAHLDRHRPQVAIVLIGENNSWNAIRLDAPDMGPLARLDALLLHSRVYKFVRVAAIGLRHNTFHEAAGISREARDVGDEGERIGLVPPSEGEPHVESFAVPAVPQEALAEFLSISEQISKGGYEEAVVRLRAFIEAYPEEANGWASLGGALLRLDRLDEAAEVLTRGLATARPSVTFEEMFHALGAAHQRAERIDDALAAWKDGLRHFPESKALYWVYARAWHERGETFHALALEPEIPEVVANPMHTYLKELSRQSTGRDVVAEMSEAFREDLWRVVRLARARGVHLIFSSYPDVVYPEVEAVAREAGAAFVDFRPHFQARFTSRDEYISPDRCHCNTAGYRLMAEVFADEVERLLGPAVQATR